MTAELGESIREEYSLDSIVFQHRPLGESMVARRNFLTTQMDGDWGDERGSLWNPPFDVIPFVERRSRWREGRA